MQQRYYHIRALNFLLIAMVMLQLSCSTTRQLERKQLKAAYDVLKLPADRNDNPALYLEAASWLNVPHRDGGTNRKGVDCSFLVGAIYQQVYDKKLERNSATIMDKNCRKISKRQLNEGDLVFFNTSKRSGNSINHVGIYLKNEKFLHASTSRGVIVSDLNEPYYQKTWVCAGRVK